MTLKNRVLNEERSKLLHQLIESKGFVKVIEAHNGLSALVGNNTSLTLEDGSKREFDALWISSLTDSAARGNPDVELFDFHARLDTINEVAEVSTKPIIVDGDTGRDFTYFEYMVKKLERAGVSAIIIEDKIFPKRNSLDGGSKQVLEDPERFASKIKRGKVVAVSEHFMIIARIESLIAGCGIEDALKRARIYLEAGVDGIMIHSKSKDPAEIFEFAERYKTLCAELGITKPLVCVPTTYNIVSEKELQTKGFNVAIYANHLLRVSHKSMRDVCRLILSHERSFETDPYCSPVKEIFGLVGSDDIKKKDAEEFATQKLNVIIPAAGQNDVLSTEKPCSMLELGQSTVLGTQVEILRKVGLSNINVIRGFKKEQINLPTLEYFDNDDYFNNSILASMMLAAEKMDNGFISVYSDIIFDEDIIKRLVAAAGDIVIVVDDSYQYHQHEVNKILAVVRTSKKSRVRDLQSSGDHQILAIGTTLSKDVAQYEFTGIAKFSKEGAEHFKNVYSDCQKNHNGQFHEAESFQKAKLTDMMQEMIDRGFKVSFVEVHKGWMEIHSPQDYEVAKSMVN